ncbi:hypothetical protein [Roseofilum capinflatum]|uniref:Uncharacterized protein n=1 Tax=Roseofilum capinflatum BLCC-M114 TaxID=3022440 RepID=A0ABT7B0X9_9CYAN|nr:hypothetical protein [Roseofilum capinflatum]MDJ1172794.1 hypothetical protein [Roseofilum capinflatum BLCC-M114]
MRQREWYEEDPYLLRAKRGVRHELAQSMQQSSNNPLGGDDSDGNGLAELLINLFFGG